MYQNLYLTVILLKVTINKDMLKLCEGREDVRKLNSRKTFDCVNSINNSWLNRTATLCNLCNF